MPHDVIISARAKLESAKRAAQNARHAMAKAEEDVKRWEIFIAAYSELAQEGYEIEAHAEESHAEAESKWQIRDRNISTSSRGGTMETTEKLVIDIILKVGRPIKTRELLLLLGERGFVVGGQDPASTLSARLSRSSRVVNERRYGWMTKEMADGGQVSHTSPSADHPPSGPVEPEAGGGT